MTDEPEDDAPQHGPVPLTQVTIAGFNGQGKLRVGGNWGNKGGRGNRPDRIKKLAQKALLPRLRILAKLADGHSVRIRDNGEDEIMDAPSSTERIRAIEALHKIGMGETVTVSDVRERLKAQLAMMRTREQWDTDDLISALGDVWA